MIIGVDRLLDMCRTVLNVTGDLAWPRWSRASGARSRKRPPRAAAVGLRGGALSSYGCLRC